MTTIDEMIEAWLKEVFTPVVAPSANTAGSFSYYNTANTATSSGW